ncbi:MAG: RNA polymerase sigma factor [Acidimicrobiia bacterium]|nr:RNA polymerase sigma factor [Acidimicrobiia bacterium]
MSRDNPVDETDADLIRRSLVDSPMFAVIFDRHYGSIHRYLVRRLGPEVGGELSSETFLRAFNQRDRFDPSHLSARPWLFGIAANLARMEARRRYLESRSLGLGPASTGPEDFAADVAVRLDAMEEARKVGLYAFLERLRESDRQVLLFYALGDLTQGEIALALGIPLGTVKSRLHRTRAALRELFEPERQSGPHERDSTR